MVLRKLIVAIFLLVNFDFVLQVCADFILPKFCLQFVKLYKTELQNSSKLRAKLLLHMLYLVQSGVLLQSDADTVINAIR